MHSRVVDTDSTPDVQIITPLEDFLSKDRVIKALIVFSIVNPSYLKIFYGRVAKYHLENGGSVVTYIFPIEQVTRSSVSRSLLVTVKRCIGLFVTAATFGIIAANTNADADDACSGDIASA